jgi:hypothetical protein
MSDVIPCIHDPGQTFHHLRESMSDVNLATQNVFVATHGVQEVMSLGLRTMSDLQAIIEEQLFAV